MRPRLWWVLVSMFFAVAGVSPRIILANVIEYELTGTMQHIGDPDGLVAGLIDVNDPFHMTVRLDQSTKNSINTSEAEYIAGLPQHAATVRVGSVSGVWTGSNTIDGIVLSPSFDGYDAFHAMDSDYPPSDTSASGGSTDGSFILDGMTWGFTLEDRDAAAFTNTDLPLSIDISQYEGRSFVFFGLGSRDGVGSGIFLLNGVVTDVVTSVIPVLPAVNRSSVYVPVVPCRIVDTRKSVIGDIDANSSRRFLVSGTAGQLAVQGGSLTGCPDPKAGTGVKPLAVSAYVLAVPSTGSTQGVLTAYPSDQPTSAPGAGSTVNYAARNIIGNTTNIRLCEPSTCPADGEFAILSRTSNQHVVVDVQGYYYPATANCPDDMVAAGYLCVDKYEASVWDAPTGSTNQFGITVDNYPCQDNGSDCGAGAAAPIYARSVADGAVRPSAFITWYQANQACANVGKRLPTIGEWQMAASGTPSGTVECNVGTGIKLATGTFNNCISVTGAFDMVGNVWEWGAELESTASDIITTNSLAALMLGDDFNNSSGTPNTKSVLVLDGTGGSFDDGPNSGSEVMGFRCVR